MLSTSYQDVVVFEPTGRARRLPRFRGPLAAVLTIAAVVASGAMINRLDDASSRATATAHPSQPFDHFPR